MIDYLRFMLPPSWVFEKLYVKCRPPDVPEPHFNLERQEEGKGND
jgi:hypothetical protein